MKVKRTERGWAGHFIGANRCRFRRNTLLEFAQFKLVVSTVGMLLGFNKNPRFEEIELDRYYETRVFHADYDDNRYYDIDVMREVRFQSEWSISSVNVDDLANIMHENVVTEITRRLENGEDFS